ncbi:MAG TPA: hypothetical protein PLP62_10240 [Flavobacteriaceae bacterium]|nr:hypothetical protein [Flavobacteriaceae bacterium]MCB9212661.1 hypothetical protein [Alteromonas sp.]HPF11824.1 hypothetical protein [Flavobacteriaceae bacterium]HQU65025.1 hypothetical protein [Flavobacteriaceae bacterium]HRW45258.1 hypothetical protein [Flavobacteriaceae bacterium]
MKYKNIREEELKNKVGADWFRQFDTTEILGNIDFTVLPKQDSLFGRTPLLWAEAKTGNFDIPTMFVQLILTIGKARTFDKTLPPAFLGAFDFKKIAFVDYINVQDIFFLNDFNWNVTPSNHDTKEFKLIKERIESVLKVKTYVFDYQKDEKELKTFIKNNVAKATTKSKIKIDKNNFIPIYLRWVEIIKPIIDVNWDDLKKNNILDSDFYLADLFVDDHDTQNIEDDNTIRDSLFVVFQNQGYKIAKENIKQMFDATINIRNKDAYTQFWKLYKRPPIKEFQDYIIERRDLLVPQDIRERKGAFFTPRIWVELSQKYLTDYLGEDWQDDYYIWDCAAGTGNLLAGLTNKYNIYASTLDQADINVMHERIEHGANLLKNHVFQFDFLNDDFSKLPQSLQDIINDPEKRKKLIVYINPPYAETATFGKKSKEGLSQSYVNTKYGGYLSNAANRELFVQFITRIYFEIPDCVLAHFSKLKILSGDNFKSFRNFFKAKWKGGFLCPAYTFDNVKGQFPIGFLIWDTNIKEEYKGINLEVFNAKRDLVEIKFLHNYDIEQSINKWLIATRNRQNEIKIGFMSYTGNVFQTNNQIFIKNDIKNMVMPRGSWITDKNLVEASIYYSVRKVVPATWTNDRDQFLFPKDEWQTDYEFQNDSLTFTLFNNNISENFGLNNWIPFTEQEVNAQNRFESHFMTDFINGKIKNESENNLFGNETSQPIKREFSAEAKSVFDAGRELWKYYHSQPSVNVNASFYDIREFFQGRNEKGIMNGRSDDETYMELIGELRNKLNFLADKIKPKIYEYEFLKE